MRIEILTKNDKDMIEISEKKLRELIKDSYNDGYSNGYENGKKSNYWYYGNANIVPCSTNTSTSTITSNAEDGISNIVSGKVTLANNDSSLTINNTPDITYNTSIRDEVKDLGYKLRHIFLDEDGNIRSVNEEGKE